MKVMKIMAVMAALMLLVSCATVNINPSEKLKTVTIGKNYRLNIPADLSDPKGMEVQLIPGKNVIGFRYNKPGDNCSGWGVMFGKKDGKVVPIILMVIEGKNAEGCTSARQYIYKDGVPIYATKEAAIAALNLYMNPKGTVNRQGV